jgi:hypothetical protein
MLSLSSFHRDIKVRKSSSWIVMETLSTGNSVMRQVGRDSFVVKVLLGKLQAGDFMTPEPTSSFIWTCSPAENRGVASVVFKLCSEDPVRYLRDSGVGRGGAELEGAPWVPIPT